MKTHAFTLKSWCGFPLNDQMSFLCLFKIWEFPDSQMSVIIFFTFIKILKRTSAS